MDITAAGYKSLKQSPLYFEVLYTPEGIVCFAPMAIEVVAASEEDVRQWMKKNHPHKIIVDIISNHITEYEREL